MKPEDGINTEKLSWVEIEPLEAELRFDLKSVNKFDCSPEDF